MLRGFFIIINITDEPLILIIAKVPLTPKWIFAPVWNALGPFLPSSKNPAIL